MNVDLSALATAVALRSFEQARSEPSFWGRLVENAVGAHLLNHLQGVAYEVTCWRERQHEVDYVVRGGRTTWALEVKSGRPGRPTGMEALRRRHPTAVPLLVGSDGMALEDFFVTDPRELLASLKRGR